MHDQRVTTKSVSEWLSESGASPSSTSACSPMSSVPPSSAAAYLNGVLWKCRRSSSELKLPKNHSCSAKSIPRPSVQNTAVISLQRCSSSNTSARESPSATAGSASVLMTLTHRNRPM